MKKKRIEYIDIAKGICILLVVLGHELTWNDALRYFIYSFHIPMFFALSGMVMVVTYELDLPFDLFLKKNINGILKPYFQVSIIYIAYDLVGGGTARNIIIEIIQTIMGYGINVLWFLSALFFGKILVWCFYKKIFVKHRKIGVVFTAFLGLAVLEISEPVTVIFSSGTVGSIMGWLFLSLVRPIVAGFFILFGVYWISIFEKIKNNPTAQIMLISLLLINIGVMVMKDKITLVNMISNPSYVVLISGISGTISLLAISKMAEEHYVARFLRYVGKNSMLIMVTHEYLKIRENVQDFLSLKINNYFFSITITFILVLIIEMLICIVYNKCKKIQFKN